MDNQKNIKKYNELRDEIDKIEFEVPLVEFYFKGNWDANCEDYEIQGFKFYKKDEIMKYYKDIIEGNMFIMDNWLWDYKDYGEEVGYIYDGLYIRQINYGDDSDVFDLDCVWDFEEIRKQKKKEAMDYLRKVFPKYVRHYLYKPKGIMAKKAKEDFENKI